MKKKKKEDAMKSKKKKESKYVFEERDNGRRKNEIPSPNAMP